jgi:hypothetical protein
MEKPGGENNENKIRKLELMLKTSTREKKSKYTRS